MGHTEPCIGTHQCFPSSWTGVLLCGRKSEMSKTMNCICLESPPRPSGIALHGTGVPAQPILLRETNRRLSTRWLHEGTSLLLHCPFHSHRNVWIPLPGHRATSSLWHLSQLGSCSPWCDSSGWWLPRAVNSIHMETLSGGNMAVPRTCLIFLMVSISQSTRDRKHGRCFCGTPDVHQTHITAAFHSTTRPLI